MHALIGPLIVSLALGQSAPAPTDTSPAAPQADVAPAPSTTQLKDSPVHTRAWVPAILGGVTLIAGATFLIIGEVQYNSAKSLPTQEEVEAAQSNATSNVVGGVALLSFGALMGALATMLFLWTPLPDTAHVGFAPTQGGGLFSFGLELP